MTSGGADEPRPFLDGDLAAQWFYSRRGGGAILDFHRTIIAEILGPAIPYNFRAAIDPQSGRPTTLIIEVAMPADDTAWARITQLQEALIESEDDLRGLSGSRNPFRNIVLVPVGLPADWTTWADEVARPD